MKNICRFDKGQIKGKAEKTDEGYIRANAVLTRTGVFVYQNPDGTTRRELRHPDDVFAADSLETIKMIPITIGHPEAKMVTAENAKELSVGLTGETVQIDGAHLLNSLTITHKEAVERTDMGTKELSLGYVLDLEKIEGEYNGERYDHRQRNIRYNHLAMVDRARAGGAASLNLDASDALQIDAEKPKSEPTKEKPTMKKVTLDGIDYDAAPEVVNALAKANKRADEAEKLSAETKTALDAEKAEKAKVEAERDTLKETAEKNSDGETIREAVKARMDMERVANKVITGEKAKEIANMDDAAIKEAVIKAKFPKANLDGKEAAYIDARFDAAAEMIEGDKTPADQKAAMNEVHGDGTPKKGTEDKKNEAFDAMKNSYKGKKEK